MIQILEQWDIAAFFWLNSLHTFWLDPVMELISTRWFWIPFYVLIAYNFFRTNGWKVTLFFIGCWIMMITLTDQVASGLLKPWVGRIRPCRPEAGLEFAVHTVNNACGGMYSFASSHAGNFFAMATFFSLIFKQIKWTWVFFTIATLVAYSRIYLGVHYPGDILAGVLIGLSTGAIWAWIYHQLRNKWPDL